MNEKISFAGASDLPELFERFAEWYRFNPRLREKDYFDWQFRDAPVRLSDAEYDFLILRNADGRICGCFGGCGFEFRYGSEVRVGVWSHNWLAEGSRNGGLQLLTRWLQLADNRILIRLNEMSGGITRLYRMPMLDVMPRWWGVLDPRAAEVFGFTGQGDVSLLTSSRERLARNLDGDTRFTAVARLPDDVEFQFGHLGGMRGYVRRTGRFLNWRYLDIPRHNYQIVRSEQAFAVFRIEPVMHTEVSVIRLLEWTFGPEEAKAALASIFAAAAGTSPVLIDFHCASPRVGAILAACGFMPQSATAKAMPDLFRPANYSGGYAVAIDLPPHRTRRDLDFDDWYITCGDSDLDRIKL